MVDQNYIAVMTSHTNYPFKHIDKTLVLGLEIVFAKFQETIRYDRIKLNCLRGFRKENFSSVIIFFSIFIVSFKLERLENVINQINEVK